MNFEQALFHMKKGGTAKLGEYLYRFSKLGDGPEIGIVQSKEGRESDLTITAITLTSKDLLSNDWEIAEK